MNNFNLMQTNIDWIGEIPVNWELKRGKYLFKFKKEINKNLQSKNLLSLTLNGVLNKDFQSYSLEENYLLGKKKVVCYQAITDF